MKRIWIMVLSMIGGFFIAANAEEYIVIAHEGSVFDQPNSKGYVTTNQNGDNVIVKEGMVFKKKESRQGWDIIEYTPGLNGFILQSLEAGASELKAPSTGTYNISNQPGTSVTVTKEGPAWIATTGGKKYSGQAHDGAVIFYDASGNVAMSLVILNGAPVMYNYSNELTHFF